MAAGSLRRRPARLLRLAVYGTCVLMHTHKRKSEQQNGGEVFASKGQLLLLSLPCPLPEHLEKRAGIPALPYIRRLLSPPGPSHGNRAKMETGSSV